MITEIKMVTRQAGINLTKGILKCTASIQTHHISHKSMLIYSTMFREPESRGAAEVSSAVPQQSCRTISPNFLSQILKHHLEIALNITRESIQREALQKA